MPIGACLTETKPLATGCRFLRVPEDRIVVKRQGTILGPAPPPCVEPPSYGLHEHTVEQEYKTLSNRHLFQTPEADVRSVQWKWFRKTLRGLSNKIGYIPRASARDVVGHRIAMKRSRFGRGMETYLRRGVRKQDSYLTEMQKLEFYEESKIAVKEDRGIQFRSPVYNAALARHLHNCESALYKQLNKDGTPIFAKGYSPLERGLILHAMASRFKKPKFMLIDHSRFDAHVNMDTLKEEHRFWLRLRKYHPELIELLKMQEQTTGFSWGGIVYKLAGKRCSGDMNTGGGNSVLNYGFIQSYLDYYNIDGTILIDGDDAVVVVEDDVDLPSFAEWCLSFGMVTVVDIVNDIRHAEFCQGRVIYTELGPVMTRNPMKVLDVLTKCPRKLTQEQARLVLAASATGELMQAPGVPVLAPAAVAMLKYANSEPGFITPDDYGRFEVYRTKGVVPLVDDTARHDFEVAWGITIAEQLAVEAYYQDLSPDVPLNVKMPTKQTKVPEFDIWDDCIFQYQPDVVDKWWRNGWAISELLN